MSGYHHSAARCAEALQEDQAAPNPGGRPLDVMMELECLDIDDACISAIGKVRWYVRIVHIGRAEGGGFALDVKRINVKKGTAVSTGSATAKSRRPQESGDAVIVQVVGPKPVTKPPKPKTVTG